MIKNQNLFTRVCGKQFRNTIYRKKFFKIGLTVKEIDVGDGS